MIIKYTGYEEIRIGLEKIITPETVFVCVGSSKVVFDIFGPMMGELLKRRGIPYYGDCKHNVNAVTMYDRLEEIYSKDGHENYNIVAIDAAVTEYIEDKNKIILKEGQGVKPGAGMGKSFPMIGQSSILLFTLHKSELVKTMHYYGKGLYVGRKKDLCDIKQVRRHAIKLANLIADIYNDVCSKQNVCIDN